MQVSWCRETILRLLWKLAELECLKLMLKELLFLRHCLSDHVKAELERGLVLITKCSGPIILHHKVI